MDQCRLVVRPAEEIERHIDLLLEYYKQTEYVVGGDARRGYQDRRSPLVLQRTMDVWNSNRSHVREGCLNNPPLQSVYLPKELHPGTGQVGCICHRGCVP